MLRSESLRDGLAVTLALFPLALYAARRDLDGLDGPEFALVARTLGLAHPPGQPLHTLVAFALSRLVSGYLGVTLASVLPLCLTAIPLASLTASLRPSGADDAGHDESPLSRSARVARGLVLAAALLVAPVFETGTRVEVYALASLGLFSALAFAARGAAFRAGLAAGLTVCAHLSFGAVAALAALVALLDRGARSTSLVRSLSRLFVGALVGLAPYAWLPLAARDPARFAWGAPNTLARFIDVMTFKAYRHNLHGTPEALSTSLRTLAPLLVPAFVALALAAVFLRLVVRPRARWLAASLLLVGLAHIAQVAINAPFPGNPDLQGYLVPVALVSAIVSGAALTRCAPRSRRAGRATIAVTLAALTCSLAIASSLRWIASARRGVSAQRLLVAAALRDAPSNALVLLESDTLGFGALYVHEAEGERSDLVLLPGTLVLEGWYRRHLRARHPTLRMPSGLFRTRRDYFRALFAANSARPVVGETRAQLRELGYDGCAGVFLVHAREPCEPFAPPTLAARLRTVRDAARAASTDWIQQRLVSSEGWRLARDDREEHAAGRALGTLAAALDRDAPDDPARRGAVCFPRFAGRDLHVPPRYVAQILAANRAGAGACDGDLR